MSAHNSNGEILSTSLNELGIRFGYRLSCIFFVKSAHFARNAHFLTVN